MQLAHHPGAVARMPAYDSVSATMYKDRHATTPPFPNALQDLQIVPQQYQLTLSGQPFLMSWRPGNRFILFTTVDNLTRLCQANIIYMDGTFDAAPQIFSQLYTIHAFIDERFMPFVYVLLKSKTANANTEMLTALHQSCNQHDLQLQPAIMTNSMALNLRQPLN